jgi:hypothetical protein
MIHRKPVIKLNDSFAGDIICPKASTVAIELYKHIQATHSCLLTGQPVTPKTFNLVANIYLCSLLKKENGI